ncbi:hypothetical protein [Flavobacterium psychrotrophum]|uniref:hypothetical protein n=1 Tax=Flavobacterium psychrotrophum TaxID=2294119 RepID=UPI000E323AD0|nr:hypothetical protein [Flavobacterium psychrotrophum]
MREFDLKHLAYHVLVSLYFIWLPLFCILIGLQINSKMSAQNGGMDKILLLWIFLNLVIGTSLFSVLRLFGLSERLGKIISYSYCILAVVSIVTVMFALN